MKYFKVSSRKTKSRKQGIQRQLLYNKISRTHIKKNFLNKFVTAIASSFPSNFSQSKTIFVALFSRTWPRLSKAYRHRFAFIRERERVPLCTGVAEWHAKKQWEQRAKRKKRLKSRRSRSTLLEEATGEGSIYEEGG